MASQSFPQVFSMFYDAMFHHGLTLSHVFKIPKETCFFSLLNAWPDTATAECFYLHKGNSSEIPDHNSPPPFVIYVINDINDTHLSFSMLEWKLVFFPGENHSTVLWFLFRNDEFLHWLLAWISPSLVPSSPSLSEPAWSSPRQTSCPPLLLGPLFSQSLDAKSAFFFFLGATFLSVPWCQKCHGFLRTKNNSWGFLDNGLWFTNNHQLRFFEASPWFTNNHLWGFLNHLIHGRPITTLQVLQLWGWVLTSHPPKSWPSWL